MIFSIFYDIVLHIYACWAACSALLKGKGTRSILSRCKQKIPKIDRAGRSLVWVHAVSFGEVKAVTELIQTFSKKGCLVVLSTASQTGYAEAQKIPQVVPLFLPMDFRYLIYPLVKKIRPDLLVITESDFWYNFQNAVRKYGGKIVVVNGKLSERSFNRYRVFPFVAKRLFGTIDHFCLQTEGYKRSFSALGVKEDKLSLMGNLKLDSVMKRMSVQEKEEAKTTYAINAQDFVITLGSTHHPEEKIWLQAYLSLIKKYPNLKIFLVPRHLERVDELLQLLRSLKISHTRVSQQGNFKEGPVVLVDKMGVLLQFYQLADLAFVGGSFTPKVGGHNLIEPANYGVCTIYGPHLHSQPGFAALMKEYEAGMVVQPEELEMRVAQLIEDKSLLNNYGKRGISLVEGSKGALEKTWNKIQEFLVIK